MQISRALLALTEGVRLRLAGVVLLGLLATAAGLLSLILAGYAIGSVFAGGSMAAVWPLLAAAALVAVLRGVLGYQKESAGAAVALRVKARLRTRIYEHLLALGPGYLERHQTGALVASAVDGVEALEVYYGKYLPQLALVVLAPLGIFIFLWMLQPLLALIIAVFLVLALVLPTTFRKTVRRRGRLHWGAYTNLAALMVDSLQGLPTLKAFTRAKDRGREISAVAA